MEYSSSSRQHQHGRRCRRVSWLQVVSHLVFVALILILKDVPMAEAQTEGDTGYDYNDAYDEEYDDNSVLGLVPEFDVKIVNVTVVAGQTAVLPCSIDYLGKYTVIWLDHDAITLTYEDRRVVDDSRFSIVRPYIKEWNLVISDIKWEDQGTYRCTINTNPIKEKLVQLHVKVPAQIIDEMSSHDERVQEGDTVALICNVTGVPRPEVTWYRRPANSKITDRESKMCKPQAVGPGIGLTGEMIIIQNVTRYCDDIYECVARNGVPPAVSRQIRVTVEFAPEIMMHSRRIGQEIGKDTILECYITAFPHAVNYWEKNGKRIMSSSKYRIEAYGEGDNLIVLTLHVLDLEEKDYGEYKCVAANALGRDEESMFIYKIGVPLKPTSETTRPIIVPWSQAPPYQQPTPPTKTYKEYNNNYNTVGKEEEVDGMNPGPASGRVTGSSAASIHGNKASFLLSLVLFVVGVAINKSTWRLTV